MHVKALWRYPVKSMQGEARDALDLIGAGVVGDRSYGVLDVGSGTVVSAKREGRLLEASARLAGEALCVRLPGRPDLGPGGELDAGIENWLGRPARLVRSADHGRGTFEIPLDFENDDSDRFQWSGPEGSFVDSSPVHFLTTGDLEELARERPELQWDVRRFRPNVFVDGPDTTSGLPAGTPIRIGEVELAVRKPCSRCVMTTRAQPGGIGRQLGILRHVNTAHDTNLGILLEVVRPGPIKVGDPVTIA